MAIVSHYCSCSIFWNIASEPFVGFKKTKNTNSSQKLLVFKVFSYLLRLSHKLARTHFSVVLLFVNFAEVAKRIY